MTDPELPIPAPANHSIMDRGFVVRDLTQSRQAAKLQRKILQTLRPCVFAPLHFMPPERPESVKLERAIKANIEGPGNAI